MLVYFLIGPIFGLWKMRYKDDHSSTKVGSQKKTLARFSPTLSLYRTTQKAIGWVFEAPFSL